MFDGLLRVPHFLQVCIGPEPLLKLNLIWSIKITLPYWLSVQFCCSRQNRNISSDEQALKVHAVRPLCSHLATIKRVIGRPIACIVCLGIFPGVIYLFFLTYRASYLLPASVVARGRPLLNRWSAVYVVWNSFQSRETMMWAIPNFTATFSTFTFYIFAELHLHTHIPCGIIRILMVRLEMRDDFPFAGWKPLTAWEKICQFICWESWI